MAIDVTVGCSSIPAKLSTYVPIGPHAHNSESIVAATPAITDELATVIHAVGAVSAKN